MTNPTERELSDRLADALEAFTKVYAGQVNNEGEYEDALFDKAKELLALHRAQRDWESKESCSDCSGGGMVYGNDCSFVCAKCGGSGEVIARPLAKGDA